MYAGLVFRPSRLIHALVQVIALTCVLAAAALAQTPPAPSSVTSPQGRWNFAVTTNPKGQLTYNVSRGNGPVLIQASALRLDLQGQQPLGTHVQIVKDTPGQHDASYPRVSGKASTIRDHYNSLLIETTEPGANGRKLNIEVRAYDDAVAFRYVIPEQPNLKDLRITDERTQFVFPRDPNLFALVLPNFTSQYESEFLPVTAGTLAAQGAGSKPQLIGLPLLAQVPGVAWVAISEADLRGNASMYLTNPSGGWGPQRLESRLSPHLDDPSIAITGALPWHSAWRIIQVADEPAKLIESNIVSNLSPESAIADTSWIHPGKASWDWWSGSLGPDGKKAFTTATMKYYVDFAADSGLEYMLIDAGWYVEGDITKMNGRVDIPEVVRYAKAKHVGIWIWAHSKLVEKQMDEAFALYEKWGVVGVKTDFVERDDQHGIDFYYRSAEAAAKHHIMMDYHGATKPTGIERMWPNIMGYEAVMGLEYNKGNGRENPTHEVTLPFTRMLTGPMDYTPGSFHNVTDANFEARSVRPMVRGTRAHQLAMYAIYEAAFQMVSDSPDSYKDQPAFEFIRHAPAAWDETKAINGTPAQCITLARRKGKEWYLGSMTNWTPRDLDIPLDFLGAGKYRAEIFADAEDADRLPANVSIRKQTVDRTTHLKAHLASGGGYAVRFVPVP
jgi:alpha-glucosidase